MGALADADPQVRRVLAAALVLWILAGQLLIVLAGENTVAIVLPALVGGAAVFPGPIGYALAQREESYSVSTVAGLIPAAAVATLLATQFATGGRGGTTMVLLSLYSTVLCVAVGLVSTTIGHGLGVHRR